jgi:hypothetical protein
MLDRRERCVAFLNRFSVHRVRLLILSATLLFWAAPAYAAVVAIVRPPSPSPDVVETLSRLHGELLSVGLEVRITDRPAARSPAGADARAWAEQMVSEHGADAVIAIVGDIAPIAVEVWVVGKAPGGLEVSKVSVEPNTQNASEKLAIRALEVLRSRFLESDLAARERRGERNPKPSIVTSSQGEADEPTSHSERFGVELGAAALTSLDGVGPAILPIVRLSWAARSRFLVQVALAGLGSRPTVAATTGHAQVAQQYGVLGGCYRFRSAQDLRPFLALSAGVLHTSVDGQANLPYGGHSVSQWSFLVDGSFGLGLRLYGRYHLTVAAHVQVAAPYVAIHFADSVVGTSGRPNLLLTFTLGAWL